MECYAASVGNQLRTFRDNLWVSSSWVNQSNSFGLLDHWLTTGCCISLKSNVIPGKRAPMNSTGCSTKYPCLNRSVPKFPPQEISRRFPSAQASVNLLPSFGFSNSSKELGALASALPDISVLVSEVFNVWKFDKLKLT